MANTRELSQLASLISVNDETKSISVISNLPDAKLGIGTTNPGARIDVSGDVNVSGVVTATSFSGNLTGNVTGTVNSTGVITATSGFVGNVVGVATGLSSQNNNVFITSDSIKFIINNSLVATISTAGLNMQSNKITSLGEPTAATDASTKNYADTGASDFPTGDYGGFTSGDTDAFGQVVSDFTSYDTFNLPSGSVQIEDFGVLT